MTSTLGPMRRAAGVDSGGIAESVVSLTSSGDNGAADRYSSREPACGRSKRKREPCPVSSKA